MGFFLFSISPGRQTWVARAMERIHCAALLCWIHILYTVFNHLKTAHLIYTAAGRHYCAKQLTCTSFRAMDTVGTPTARRGSQSAGLVEPMSAGHPQSLHRETERGSVYVNKADPLSDRVVHRDLLFFVSRNTDLCVLPISPSPTQLENTPREHT